MRFGRELDNLWPFVIDGRRLHVDVRGNRITNEGRLVHEWCLGGYGIALKSIWDIEADLEQGTLVRLLEDYAPPPTTLQLLFPPGRSQPRRVVEFARQLAAVFAR
jgi:DNA-binding transcriptional LysR family regulator